MVIENASNAVRIQNSTAPSHSESTRTRPVTDVDDTKRKARGWSSDDAIEPKRKASCKAPASSPRSATLRESYQALIEGHTPELDRVALRGLQVAALDVVLQTFKDPHGDAELRGAVEEKLATMSKYRLDAREAEGIVGSGPVLERQLGALRFLLATFESGFDERLRAAVMTKLAAMGEKSDLSRILLRARHGTKADLRNASSAAKTLAWRLGPPEARGRGVLDARLAAIVKPFEATPRLPASPEFLEAMLESEAVVHRERIAVGNLNPVERITFDRHLRDIDGHWHQAQAAYKPEPFWDDKRHAFFSREAAAYQLDRQFLRTEMVPPTIEAFLPRSGFMELGSLQYWIEGAQMLGRTASEWRSGSEIGHFTRRDDFHTQTANARTFLYIANDPDKLKNSVNPYDNLRNLVVDPRGHLFLIDNGTAFGGPWGEMSKDMLPTVPDPTLVGRLKHTDPDEVTEMLRPRIGAGEAKNVARRLKSATDELRARLPSRND